MAIKSITYENFRGQTRTIEAREVTILRGPNGSGKTTAKEAMCFLFCGCDSVGTRNPTHLISKDKDNTKVTIETDKAILSRTLTRKGSSTIKVERAGVATVYTQSQFEAMIGKSDTFLSALLPGYFFELDQKLKQAVLEDILPKVDKVALVEEISGVTLSAEEKLKYGFSRRSDLVASTIAQDRRSFETAINQKQGRIAQLSELSSLEEPKIQDKSAELAAIALNQDLWAAYDRDIKFVNDRKAAAARIGAENAYVEKRRAEIQEKLASLTKSAKPEYFPVDTSDLQESIRPLPARPGLINDISSEHCPSCGQVVSPKYREHVKVHNDKALADWQKECDEVNKHNALIRSEISRINTENETAKKDYLNAMEENRKIDAQTMALQRELASLTTAESPEVPATPPIPEVPYDKSAHLALLKHQDEYKSAVAVYEHKKKEFETAKEQVEKLHSEVALLIKEAERFSKLEEALKRLPEIETKKQIGVFNTEKLVFDGSNIIYDGTPAKMLSTGERAKVYLYFSKKVMSLMPTPPKAIFIDDADLVDGTELVDLELDIPNLQLFKAYVADGNMEVTYGDNF